MRDRLRSTKCARFLKALADPERLRIIQRLQTGPKNVSELSDLLGQDLANVSHHLGVLRHAGLVQAKRHGKYVLYSVHPDLNRPGRADCLDLGCCRLEWGDC